MIDSDSANANGYTGKGAVTAILDTGLDINHEAFVNAP
jgi:subtilisin family serine protease